MSRSALRTPAVALPLVLLPLFLLGVLPGRAQEPASPEEEISTSEAVASEEEAPSDWVAGPATVTLGSDLAELDVAEGFSFVGEESTRQMMAMMGNPPNGGELGMLLPSDEDAGYFIVFEYSDVGHVTDEDSAEIDADALLTSIRDATEAANEYRAEHGGGELHVTDWQIPPHYDGASHHLTWALDAVDEEQSRIVNYNVRLLGREGYTSVTLVTGSDQLAIHRPQIEKVLTSFRYLEGRRYADYVSGDKLAGYGLAALVAGGAGAAAAKLGLFAVLGKFLGKIWKLLVVAVVAGGTFLKRLFGRRRPASGEIG